MSEILHSQDIVQHCYYGSTLVNYDSMLVIVMVEAMITQRRPKVEV